LELITSGLYRRDPCSLIRRRIAGREIDTLNIFLVSFFEVFVEIGNLDFIHTAAVFGIASKRAGESLTKGTSQVTEGT
jgi:hypothetical protein